jgi:hypothetical protein
MHASFRERMSQRLPELLAQCIFSLSYLATDIQTAIEIDNLSTRLCRDSQNGQTIAIGPDGTGIFV